MHKNLRRASIYNIEVKGFLGKAPEMSVTKNGTPVMKFSIGDNSAGKDQNGIEKPTVWYRINVWKKQAEYFSGFLNKGDKVWIKGHLEPRVWVNRDGKDVTSLEVHAREMEKCEKKTRADYQAGEDMASQSQSDDVPENWTEDSVPF